MVQVNRKDKTAKYCEKNKERITVSFLKMVKFQVGRLKIEALEKEELN